MEDRCLNTLELRFYECDRFPPAGGAAVAMRLLQQHGGRLLGERALEPDPEPFRYISSTGNAIAVLFVEHERLRKDARTCFNIQKGVLPPDVQGRAAFSVRQSNRSLGFDQSVGADPASGNLLAASLSSFANFLYPHLRPRFGFVDELGTQPKQEAAVIAGEAMPYLYWATVFGPTLVERLGAAWLADAPGEWLVELDDGGRMLVACAEYETWWAMADHPTVDYFRHRFPDIQKYVAEKD